MTKGTHRTQERRDQDFGAGVRAAAGPFSTKRQQPRPLPHRRLGADAATPAVASTNKQRNAGSKANAQPAQPAQPPVPAESVDAARDVARRPRGTGRDDDSLLISRKQAADILGVHPNTITNKTKRGQIERVELDGLVRYRRRDIMNIVEHGIRSKGAPRAAKVKSGGQQGTSTNNTDPQGSRA